MLRLCLCGTHDMAVCAQNKFNGYRLPHPSLDPALPLDAPHTNL
jgi:hypothetical protein